MDVNMIRLAMNSGEAFKGSSLAFDDDLIGYSSNMIILLLEDAVCLDWFLIAKLL